MSHRRQYGGSDGIFEDFEGMDSGIDTTPTNDNEDYDDEFEQPHECQDTGA